MQVAGASVTSTKPKRPSKYVKVPNFAFVVQDERHVVLGADVPRANRLAWLNQAVGNCNDGDGLSDEDGTARARARVYLLGGHGRVPVWSGPAELLCRVMQARG